MRHLSVVAVASLLFVSSSAAQDVGTYTPEKLSSAYSGEAYSPYAKRTFPERPLWGDTHLHTSLSMDARAFGNWLGPRAAYRVARGDEIISSSGQPVRLSRPLDWLVIADHTDGMGMMTDIIAATPQVMETEQGARWSRAIRSGRSEAIDGHDGFDHYLCARQS